MPISIGETIVLLKRMLSNTEKEDAIQPVIYVGDEQSILAKGISAISARIHQVDMQNHPLRKKLLGWISEASSSPENENDLFQALFILLSACFEEDKETRINWFGKLLLYKIFSEEDIQAYLQNPTLNVQFSHKFRRKHRTVRSTPHPVAVVSEQTDSVANTPHLFAKMLPAESRQQALSFASFKSLWNARNVLFSSNVVLLRKRGREACQMQTKRMIEWLSTEQGRLQFVARKGSYKFTQFTFEKMLLDPESDDQHKLCCLMMITVFYGNKDFEQSSIVRQLVNTCKKNLFYKHWVVASHQIIYLALELLLTTDCLQVDEDIESFIQTLFESIIKEKGWPKIEFDDGVKRLCSIPKIQLIIFKICDGILNGDEKGYHFNVVFDIMMRIVCETRDPVYLFHFVIRLLERLDGVIGPHRFQQEQQFAAQVGAMAFQKLCELSVMFDRMPEGCIEHALKMFINNIFIEKYRYSRLASLKESLNQLIKKRPEQASVIVDQLCKNYRKDPDLIRYCLEKMDFSCFDEQSLRRLVSFLLEGLRKKTKSSLSLFCLLQSMFTQCPEKLTGVSERVVAAAMDIFFNSLDASVAKAVSNLLERAFLVLPEDGVAANKFVLRLSKSLFDKSVSCGKVWLLAVLSNIFLIVKERAILTKATVLKVANDLVKLCSESKEFFPNIVSAMKALMLSYPAWVSEIILPVLTQELCQTEDDFTANSVCNILGSLALSGCCAEEIFSIFKGILLKQGQYADSQKALKSLTDFIQIVWGNQISYSSDREVVTVLTFLEEIYIARLEVQQEPLVSDPFFLMLKKVIFSLVERASFKDYAFAAKYHETLLHKEELLRCRLLLCFWYKVAPPGFKFFSSTFLENYFCAVVDSKALNNVDKRSMLKAVLRWVRRNPTECLSAVLYQSILDFSRSCPDLLDRDMRGNITTLTDSLDVKRRPDLLEFEITQKRFQLSDRNSGVVKSACNRLAEIAKLKPALCLSVGFIQDSLPLLRKENYEKAIEILQSIIIHCQEVKIEDEMSAILFSAVHQLIEDWDPSVKENASLCCMLASISVRWYKPKACAKILMEKIEQLLEQWQAPQYHFVDNKTFCAIVKIIGFFQTARLMLDVVEKFDNFIALCGHFDPRGQFSEIAESVTLLSNNIINCARHELADQAQVNTMIAKLMAYLNNCCQHKSHEINHAVLCVARKLHAHFPEQFKGFQNVFHGFSALQKVVLDMSLAVLTTASDKAPAVDDENTESTAPKNTRS